LVLVISLLITRIATIALTYTGLSRQAAKFQARSAFTGVGFTTSESEKVVMEERRLRVEDNPQAYLIEQVHATAFQTQPYHWPISGWMPDLRRLSAKDAENWYQTYYHPANACIVAVGDFNSERLIREIRKFFGKIPTGNGPFRTAYADPPQQGERRVQVNSKKTRLPFMTIGYHVPNISAPDSYALEVLSTVLSGGRSARLLKNLLYEKQIARRIQSSYSLLSFDPDLFVIYAEPFPDIDLENLETAIADEINKLQSEAVGERELEKAKNRLEAAFVFAQDSILHQAMLLARYQLSSGWREVNNYIAAVHAVTAAEVQEAARRYLNPENRTVGRLIPEAGE
jgi:zinc protease